MQAVFCCVLTDCTVHRTLHSAIVHPHTRWQDIATNPP
ncbi:hypothetical protein A2U01_0098571, partial [Trifolium medium]|nr:hypothetical protein [Trifolium medium]